MSKRKSDNLDNNSNAKSNKKRKINSNESKVLKGDEPQITLHDAVELQDIESLEKLLDNSANINAIDNNGNTALHLCAANGFIDGIELLMSEGASYHIENFKKYKAADIAIQNDQGSALVAIIEQIEVSRKIRGSTQKNINTYTGKYLKKIVESDKLSLFKEMVDNFKISDSKLVSFMSEAIRRGHNEIAKFIFSISAKSCWRKQLADAIEYDNQDMIEYFFEVTPEETFTKAINGVGDHNSLLSDVKSIEIAESLIAKGADLNKMFLKHILWREDFVLADYFMGQIPNIEEYPHANLLHDLVKDITTSDNFSQKIEILNYLLSKNFDINRYSIVTSWYDRPKYVLEKFLEEARYHHHHQDIKLLRYLLNKGANVNYNMIDEAIIKHAGVLIKSAGIETINASMKNLISKNDSCNIDDLKKLGFLLSKAILTDHKIVEDLLKNIDEQKLSDDQKQVLPIIHNIVKKYNVAHKFIDRDRVDSIDDLVNSINNFGGIDESFISILQDLFKEKSRFKTVKVKPKLSLDEFMSLVINQDSLDQNSRNELKILKQDYDIHKENIEGEIIKITYNNYVNVINEKIFYVNNYFLHIYENTFELFKLGFQKFPNTGKFEELKKLSAPISYNSLTKMINNYSATQDDQFNHFTNFLNGNGALKHASNSVKIFVNLVSRNQSVLKDEPAAANDLMSYLAKYANVDGQGQIYAYFMENNMPEVELIGDHP